MSVLCALVVMTRAISTGTARAVVFVPGLVLALLTGCGNAGPTRSAVPRVTKATSPALARIQKQPSKLLDGGTTAFKKRMSELRGYPVVVNQWASWCPPCRREFPFFQRAAARLGYRVAFLGVDSKDNRGAAKGFLRKFPTPYPHYFDPDSKIARTFRGGIAWPTTAFFTRAGKLTFSHPGAYRSEADLLADIRRYSR